MKLQILNKIRAPWFIGAFVVGLLITYVMGSKQEVVVKFPSPFNTGNTIYQGEDACFKYHAEEVDCPNDESKIKIQPLK